MDRGIAMGVAGVLLVGAGCGGYEVPIIHEVSASSELIEFRGDPSLPVCGGTWDYINDFAAAYATTLPDDVDVQWPIVYHYLSPLDQAERTPCLDGTHCAWLGHVYSSDASQLHELVHAVRQRAYGDATPGASVLEEGIASLYMSDRVAYPVGHLSLNALATIDGYLGGHDYAPAAHFAGFVQRRIGAKMLSAFIATTGDLGSYAEFPAAYDSATGDSWWELVDAYLASPACPGYLLAARPVECATEPAVDLGDLDGPIELAFPAFSCDAPEAIGPVAGQTSGYLVLQAPDPDGREIRLSVEAQPRAEANLRFSIAPCGGGCDRPHDSARFSGGAEQIFEIHAAPGRSVVWFSVDVDAVVDVVVRITPTDLAPPNPTPDPPGPPPTPDGETWCTRAVGATFDDGTDEWPLEPYLPDVAGGPEGCACAALEVHEELLALRDPETGEAQVDDDANWRAVVVRNHAQNAAREACLATVPPDAITDNCLDAELFDTRPKAGIQPGPLYHGSHREPAAATACFVDP